MEKFNPYHQHLLVKCWATNPPKQVWELNRWFINLVETVGMKVVAGPTSVYVSDPGNEGLTGTVTLATSHASIHIWDNLELPMIQFDIYSCKCFTLEQTTQFHRISLQASSVEMYNHYLAQLDMLHHTHSVSQSLKFLY